MALTVSNQMTLTVKLVDREGNVSSPSFRFGALLDVTDFIDAIPITLVPAIAALSNAEVAGWTLTHSATDPDVPAVTQPVEASDVERKGRWSLRTANGHSVTVEIPSIDNTFVIDGTQSINRAATEVATFEDILIGNTLLDTAFLVSNRGEAVTGVVKAVKVHVASTKG